MDKEEEERMTLNTGLNNALGLSKESSAGRVRVMEARLCSIESRLTALEGPQPIVECDMTRAELVANAIGIK